MKRALITGVTGQDGSYLADFLLERDYEYSDRLGQYRDEPIEPTITDFMDWLKEATP